jgi:hypothetical protein
MATVVMDALSHQAIRATGSEAQYYNAPPERTGKWKGRRLAGVEATLASLGHSLEIASPERDVLAGAAVLIVASRSQGLPFSDVELSSIRDFVTGGGGLLLMANHQRFIMPQQQVVLALELPFGFIDTTLDGFPEIVLAPHQLTLGCESLVVRNSSSIAAPAAAPAIAHFALDPRHRFAVATEAGKGRVVATGDSGFVASSDDTGRDMFASGSNAVFFSNCIRWLARTG